MLSPYTVTIYTKQDNPYNVITDDNIDIRERLANGTSGSLSIIYSDQDGLIPITQTGAKADSNGQFTFYAEAAQYNAIYESQTVPVDVGLTVDSLPAAVINNLSLTHNSGNVDLLLADAIVFPEGKILYLADRNCKFKFSIGGTPDGYGVLDAGNGNTATIILDGTTQNDNDGVTARCSQFGMISGDSATDYAPHFAALLEMANNVYIDGRFYLSNVKVPNRIYKWRGEAGHYGRLTALDGQGSPSYFVASATWVDSGIFVNSPLHMEWVSINGSNKDHALVLRSYNCIWNNVQVYNGTDYSLLVTSKGILGTAASSSMVNNTFNDVDVFGDSDVGVYITGVGNTDWTWRGGFARNAGTLNFKADSMAGAKVTGLHTYTGFTGNIANAEFSGYGGGTTVAHNYFEGEVIIGGSIATAIMPFGPSNQVNGDLKLNFGSNVNYIKSFNNTLTSINHNAFSIQNFYSDNDSISSATPFTFTNNSAGNPATMRVTNAHLRDASFLNDTFSGYLSPAAGAIDVNSLKNDRLGLPISTRKGLTTGSTTVQHDSLIVEIPASSGFAIYWDLGLRAGTGTGVTEISAQYRWTALNIGGTFSFTSTISNTLTGSFTSGPTPSVIDNGDGTMTVRIDAEYNGSGSAIGESVINIT